MRNLDQQLNDTNDEIDLLNQAARILATPDQGGARQAAQQRLEQLELLNRRQPRWNDDIDLIIQGGGNNTNNNNDNNTNNTNTNTNNPDTENRAAGANQTLADTARLIGRFLNDNSDFDLR